MEELEKYLVSIIIFFSSLLGALGTFVIVFVAFKAMVEFFAKLKQAAYDDVRLNLIRGLALGLEFGIGSSILKIFAVETTLDIVLLAAIILIRTFLIYVIYKEIKAYKNMNKTK